MIATNVGSDITAFFRSLYPEGAVCNVRVLGSNDKPIWDDCKSYLSAGGNDEAALARFVSHHAEICTKEQAGVFIGVCPRFARNVEPKGSRDGVSYDRAWQIRETHTLWADIDPDQGAPAIDYRAAKAKWEAAELPEPSCVVQSGNGVHLYWFLDEPYLIDDVGDPEPIYHRWEGPKGSRKKISLMRVNGELEKFYGARDEQRLFPPLSPKAVALQDTLRGIMRALGSDKVHDLTRILRMPGTFNMKRPDEPRPCEIVDIDADRRYAFDDFSEARGRAKPKIDPALLNKIKTPQPIPMTDPRRKRLVPYWNKMVAAPEGSRSEAEFIYLKEAIKVGCPQAEAWGDVQGVGKFSEKNGDRYFQTSWEKAEREVKENIASSLALAGASMMACAAATTPSGSPATPATAAAAGVHEGEQDPHRLARVLANTNFAGGPVRYWRESWYVWIDAAWRPVPDSDMRGLANAAIKQEFDRIWLFKKAMVPDPGQVAEVVPGIVTGVLQALIAQSLVPAEVDWNTWLPEKNRGRRRWVALQNGILKIDELLAGSDDAIVAHSPDWWSPVRLPYAFDLNATCPRWDAFLQRNLEGDAERISVLQEFLGYTLIPSTEFQKFLIIEGNGSNGKSVICAVAEGLVGPKNTSHVPLEQFGERFAFAPMIGKLLNVVSEIGEAGRLEESVLKKIVSGDPVNADRKNKEAVDVFLTVRCIFGTNARPKFVDKSNGIWRRVILLPINVSIDEHDPSRVFGMDTADWWIEQGEMPGIFLWALQGLARLLKTRRFTKSSVIDDAIAEYRIEVNPARQFLMETCEKGSESQVAMAPDLYRAYRKWCETNGLNHPLCDRQFGKEVKSAFGVTRGRQGTGRREWFYRGLKFNPEYESSSGEF